MLAAVLLLLLTQNVWSLPNFLIIHLDDVGYGDLGAYSSRNNDLPGLDKLGKTPHIDRMAEEGILFTDFYAAACVCSPSRAGLLTGRYPVRTSVFPGVLTPESYVGLPESEVTIARWLKRQAPSYYTFSVGKWHLGHVSPFLPPDHGFDFWTGIPYSHDYCPCPASLTHVADQSCRDFLPGCPLMNNSLIIQQPAILDTLVQYYAQTTIEQMQVRQPFLGYYACQHTHHPQFVSTRLKGSSALLEGRQDAYGDSLVEMDEAVGQILDFIRHDADLLRNTIVFLLSDNGAAANYQQNAGSNFPLRCGKGTTWEGGQRVPFVVWGGQDMISTGNRTSSALVAGMDLFPTIATLAGISVPSNLDGVDFSHLLLNSEEKLSKRKDFIYYSLDNGGTADAIRLGKYKVHFRTSAWMDLKNKEFFKLPSCHPEGIELGPHRVDPLVYDLESDQEEMYPLALSDWVMENIVNKALARLRADPCVIISEPRNTKAEKRIRPVECEASAKMNCVGGNADPSPWPPKGPFLPWQQTEIQCCRNGYDVVFQQQRTNTLRGFSCLKIALSSDKKKQECEQNTCNPIRANYPQCKDKHICANNGECSNNCTFNNNNNNGNGKFEFCAKGFVLCEVNRQCVKSSRECPQKQVRFSGRLCGLCHEDDEFVEVEDEDDGHTHPPLIPKNKENDLGDDDEEENDSSTSQEAFLVAQIGLILLAGSFLVGVMSFYLKMVAEKWLIKRSSVEMDEIEERAQMIERNPSENASVAPS